MSLLKTLTLIGAAYVICGSMARAQELCPAGPFETDARVIAAAIASEPGKAGFNDGPGDKALFKAPRGIAVGPNGTVYVADSGNQTIRRISPTGEVTTLAGKPGKRGTADGQGTVARFDRPTSIAVRHSG